MFVMTDFAFAGSARSLGLMLFTVLRSTRSCSEWLLDWDNDTPRALVTKRGACGQFESNNKHLPQEASMRRTPRSLADAREELVQIE